MKNMTERLALYSRHAINCAAFKGLRPSLWAVMVLIACSVGFMVLPPSVASAWDAGTENCKTTTCDGGEGTGMVSFLDTQPRFAKSHFPNNQGREADCPAGYTNNGLTCGRGTDDIAAGSLVADCPSGYRNQGLYCYRDPSTISAPSKVADCPSGYTNTGVTCYRGPHSYTKGCTTIFKDYSCRSGYTDMGCHCQRWADSKSTGSMKCSSGYFLNKDLGRCYKECPTGYTNNGETCGRGADSTSTSAMTCPSGYFLNMNLGRCYKDCPTGYTNMGETCHRPASTKGIDAMSCKAGEFMSGVRCYSETTTCNGGYRFYAGLCYVDCPPGSKRTAISTCEHTVKWRGNTHLWVVKQALAKMANDPDPKLQRIYAKMSDATCNEKWMVGLWDGDNETYADSPTDNSTRGSHFYNPTGKDYNGNPTSMTTYEFAGVDVTASVGGADADNALQKMRYHVSRIGSLGTGDQCHHLGLALHYMTDMTQPMHTSGFSGVSVPTMQHPVWESYVPSIQARFVSSTPWDGRWKDQGAEVVFSNAATKSNSFVKGLMNSLAYDGTVCTMSSEEGILYTGFCFVHRSEVDAEIGKLLSDAPHSVVSFLRALAL